MEIRFRKKKRLSLLSKFLYLISPEKITNHKIFLKKLELVFTSNIIKFFQLRIKNQKREKIIALGKKIIKLTRKYKVNFIINDDPYITKILNADGCHLGQQDMSINFAKKILKKNSIIGITCLLYTSPSPRDGLLSRMPSSA